MSRNGALLERRVAWQREDQNWTKSCHTRKLPLLSQPFIQLFLSSSSSSPLPSSSSSKLPDCSPAQLLYQTNENYYEIAGNVNGKSQLESNAQRLMFVLFNNTLGTFLYYTTRAGRTDLQIIDSDNLHILMHLIEKKRNIWVMRAYNMGIKAEFSCCKMLKITENYFLYSPGWPDSSITNALAYVELV